MFDTNYWLSKMVAFLQRRCSHPTVTYDMLDGALGAGFGRGTRDRRIASSIAVNYCRSCGAVRAVYSADADRHEWRLVIPDRWNSEQERWRITYD